MCGRRSREAGPAGCWTRRGRPSRLRGEHDGAAMSADLVLVHLYPDLLRTYGDRGNVLTLQRRAEWRGFSVDVVGVTRGDPLPARPGPALIGGGTDRGLEAVA